MPKKHTSKTTKARTLRRTEEKKILEDLKLSVQNFSPETPPTAFADLPLSAPTKKGLRDNYFTKLTPVQQKAITPALQGQDLLGAAKTGSGKTLAFLIPLLEKLYTEQWTQNDGLGALVITPTRELAAQIFDVLRKIGKNHSFSAGLLVGGKNVQAEKSRIGRLNILIATPGRLLQHMDESPEFDALNLQVLVLDEADRLLDMGFKATLDAIVANLGAERQTLLFSATQTKSVGDLARLSLVNPTFIAVDSEKPHATPQNLDQFFTVCELGLKLDMLWSFLRSHTQNKIIVFLSSSKQVRFVFEAFRRLRPGIPLLHLHGRQKQLARMEATKAFSHARASCLIATDVVARGIDFPAVDWVLQLDCPEDCETYIHRVGRSARAGKSGRALLFLTPAEQSFAAKLMERRVPVQKLEIRDNKKASIQPDLQAQCFQDPELKYLAQKAFISYVRSVYLKGGALEEKDLEVFSRSLGLASAPQVKGNVRKNPLKNQPRALAESEAPAQRAGDALGDADAGDDNGDAKAATRTKHDRLFNRTNQDVLSAHYQKLRADNAEESDSDDLLTVRRAAHDLDESTPQLAPVPESKRAQKRALSKKAVAAKGANPTKLVFDDDGEAHPIYEFEDEAKFHAAGDAQEQRQGFVEEETQKMAVLDEDDKEVARRKREEKKRRRKEMERQALQSDSEGEAVVRLPSDASDSEPESPTSPPASPAPKRRRGSRSGRPRTIEVEQPQTLADLEALSASLLRG